MFYDANDGEQLADALDDLFSRSAIFKKYLKECFSEDTWENHFAQLQATAVRVAGGNKVDDDILERAIYLLMQSGKIKPVKAAPAPIEDTPVDDRPKDKLGRPMSGKAQQWQAWEKWCNDPQTLMAEINAKRVSDPAFREFYEYQRNLRVKEQPNDSFDPAPQQAAAGSELKSFADAYTAAEMRSLRPINGQVTLNGQKYSYAAFTKLVEDASAARLI